MIVALCAGRCEAEMYADDDFCVCLDTDERLLYAASFALKHMHSKKINVIFDHHDMSNGL